MIDRKFEFVAVNPCNGKEYTENNALILCAKDLAVVPTLEAYHENCKRIGAGQAHLESVSLLIERVRAYQVENAGITKVPDTDTDCEIKRCILGQV